MIKNIQTKSLKDHKMIELFKRKQTHKVQKIYYPIQNVENIPQLYQYKHFSHHLACKVHL